MENDPNPAATAYWDTIDETALEATIRPQAVFADVQIQGTLTGSPSPTAVEAPAVSAPAASASLAIDPKWIAVLAVAVLAIAVVAILNNQQR